jgi:ABC-2 type transport system permease protein
VVAPSLFVVGLGAFTIGGRPRATSIVVYAFLSWSFLLEFVGSGVHASHWLMDTSIFFHMVPAPAAPPDWTSTAVIAGLAVAGAIGGGFLLRRRDTLGA